MNTWHWYMHGPLQPGTPGAAGLVARLVLVWNGLHTDTARVQHKHRVLLTHAPRFIASLNWKATIPWLHGVGLCMQVWRCVL